MSFKFQLSKEHYIMGTIDTNLSADVTEFVAKVKTDAEQAFRVLRETDTTTAYGTVGFVVRVPGHEKLVVVNDPGPWDRHQSIEPAVIGFDGTVFSGNHAGGKRYNKLFVEHPDINIISHVHTLYVAAWAQTHRTFPINYVALNRHHLIRELPIYIDRRQPEVDFIIEKVNQNPQTFAILEANGGGTIWGKGGIRQLTESIILLEEAARLQLLAEAVGGSRNYGPGVLKQNWNMTGLYEEGKKLGLVPVTDL
jgi:ribulose-5-phosphate 4-epimerase/fuculose-1-phosphate aldolase